MLAMNCTRAYHEHIYRVLDKCSQCYCHRSFVSVRPVHKGVQINMHGVRHDVKCQ